MKRIIVYTFIILLLGCDTSLPQQTNTHLFNLPDFTKKLIVNMSNRHPAVNKSFSLNGNKENKNINNTDSTFWSQELARLIDTDLNSPKYLGAISVTPKQQDPDSNLLINSYSLTNITKLPLKSLRIYYLNDTTEIRKIDLMMTSDNLINASETSISLWINRYNGILLIDSLKITGKDKTLFQGTRQYQGLTKTIW